MIKLSRFLNTLSVLTLLPAPLANGQSNPIKNVVLVHGAWVDGSGWKPVSDILVKDGYNVTIVQEPLTSFDADVAATRRILGMQPGPCVLVGRSYGGSIITEAGNDKHVAALAYVAAHMPDAGESEGQDGKRFPSDLAKSAHVKTTADGYNYLDPALFPSYFAADLPAEQARFKARSQILTAIPNFTATITTPGSHERSRLKF
jgi:pimeloyl-ACP methyl ester carboxylesterase